MRQRGLTVITRIQADKVNELRSLLEAIGRDINENPVVSFASFRTVHFLRWVILDETTINEERIAAQLVLSTNFDGKLIPHLEDLCSSNLDGLFQIYSHCEGAPKEKFSQHLLHYLKKNRISIPAFYRGTAGRKVAQIHQEQSLWKKIQGLLQGSKSENGDKIKTKLFDEIKKDPSFAWAFSPYKKEFNQQFGGITLRFQALAVLAALLALIIILPIPSYIIPTFLFLFLGGWWIQLRVLEKKDEEAFIAARQDPSEVAVLMKKEDFKVQNQLTHLVEIKPGVIRLYTLKFVLWAINLLASRVYNKGNLAGIQSIHFARWVIIDKGRRLLFFSNYDGSWESYLGEFVDRAAVGLTGVWSNTVGFPPTKNLIRNGARHSAEFKAWARFKQIPTQIWYSAYPTSSIKNINNNTAIRQGLIKKMNPEKTKEWLQRL
ncbi:hypothetical protein [Algoriphagus sediminis]|uniref:Uncharacterized protein n=1 Tax=Algoriphagus sediminis TaxID=3057113 RepID=A0ABT7Y8U6_9BACT|nr:hypothetical protein [Algoriphagus sediminis]MDN3202924.1 hypothetical protein [Algoriphagus sediminis]